MLGRDHIISNVCSGVLLAEGLFAVNTCYTGVYAKEVHNVTKHMIADLVHPCNLNPWLILAISVGLFLLGTLLPDIDSTTSCSVDGFIYLSSIGHGHIPYGFVHCFFCRVYGRRFSYGCF